MASKKLQQLSQEYLKYLQKTKKRTEQTVNNYKFYLDQFFNWAKVTKPQQINDQLIKRYKMYLSKLKDKSHYKLQKTTQNYYLIALRNFLKFLLSKKITAIDPKKIKLTPNQKKKHHYLAGTELEAILEAPLKTKSPKIIQERDKSILETLFSAGLRVSEVANLKKADLDLKKLELKIKNKSKQRTLLLTNQAKYWLEKYLKNRKDQSVFLFTNHDRAGQQRNLSKKDQGLTPRSIQRLVQKYAKQAGLKQKITPQILRYSFAYQQLIKGEPTEKIQKYLGHGNLASIENYKF